MAAGWFSPRIELPDDFFYYSAPIRSRVGCLDVIAMFDFEIQRCTRRCANTGRELQAGELVHSVLVTVGAQVVRYDYSREGWVSAPENAIAVWKTRIPEPNSQKARWAPNEVILNYFTQLEHDTQREETRYVLALLLLRRRVVRQEGTQTDAANREILVLHCARDDTEHCVTVVPPTSERAEQIQEELARLLWGGES